MKNPKTNREVHLTTGRKKELRSILRELAGELKLTPAQLFAEIEKSGHEAARD